MKNKADFFYIFLLCPVPEEQKAIHEYLNLKKYLGIPLTKTEKSLEKKISIFFTNVINIFLNFFFIFRWKDLENRLNQPIVSYEEASWYDGQIWEKPFSIIKKDRLLNSQIIQPFLRKNLFFLFLFFLILFSFQFLKG